MYDAILTAVYFSTVFKRSEEETDPYLDPINPPEYMHAEFQAFIQSGNRAHKVSRSDSGRCVT